MANRIYTQADYDKVTAMDQAYQSKKDSYTPEQQKNIEKMISDAYTTVSNRIEESKNMISDMYQDGSGNVIQVYGDGRQEVVKPAATQQPKTTVKKTVTPNPKPENNNQEPPIVNEQNTDTLPPIDRSKAIDPYTSKPSDVVNLLQQRGFSEDDINLVLTKWRDKLQKEYNIKNSGYTIEELQKHGLTGPQQEPTKNNNKTDKNSSSKNNNKTNTYNPVADLLNGINNLKTEVPAFINSIPTRTEGVIDTLNATPQFVQDVKTTMAGVNKIKNGNIVDKVTGTFDTIASVPSTLKSTNNMLEGINKITNNKLSTEAIRRIIANGGRIATDGTVYDNTGKVVAKMPFTTSL